MYLGIFTFSYGLGSALGFVLAKPFLSIPSSLSLKMLISSESKYNAFEQQESGAWWLGYALIGIYTLITGITLFFAPVYNPNNKKKSKTNNNENLNKVKFEKKNKNYPLNIPSLFLIFGGFFEVIPLIGIALFLAKFLKNQFYIYKNNVFLI